MIVVMKVMLLAIVLSLAVAADDSLLRISEKSSCIREVVTVFVGHRNCSLLDDKAKSKLALKMTECLLLQMGKSLPRDCFSQRGQCLLEGDAWSTFSTFFTHVDNLCHFYWQMLHHERAQEMIGKLSESSSNAEKIMRENVQQTQKILTMQYKMHEAIDESLVNQEKMEQLIWRSTQHISNLTDQIQTFVQKIRLDIDSNYASLRNILVVINDGLTKVLSVQSYMMASLTSIQGMAYFLCLFFALLFTTSFQKYAQIRTKCIILLLLNVVIEAIFGTFIDQYIGVRTVRSVFIVAQIVIFASIDRKYSELEQIMAGHFNTPRLKRVFRKVIDQNDYKEIRREWLSSLPLRGRSPIALRDTNELRSCNKIEE